MPYLYVDNFRGFTDALIPLAPVTFLVGENSTGKSSILSLLQIVADFRFWMTTTFKTTETNLGRFGDIVSVSAKNRSYFRIGTFVSDIEPSESKWNPFSATALFTFVNNNGDPRVKYVSLFSQGRIVHFCLDKGELSFRIDPKEYGRPSTLEAARYIADAMRVAHTMGRRKHYKKVDLASRELGYQEAMFAVFFRAREFLAKEGLPENFSANPLEYGGGVRFLAPIRSHPKRTYDEPTKEYSAQGDHVPYLIQETLQHKSGSDFLKSLRAAGRGTGLFRELQPKTYGRGTSGPFELDVVLDNKPINILNVGYGVSQSMPIIVEAINGHAGSTFIIQQPEVHLHPRAQAGIGALLFELASSEQKRFLVETHSDYLIDRFRLMFRQKSEHVPDAQILFFARRSGLNEVTPLPIDHIGNLPDDQPEAYREFFVKEELALLGLE